MSGGTYDRYGSNMASSQYGGMDRNQGLQQPLGGPMQPTPMQTAFAPTQGMGGPMPTQGMDSNDGASRYGAQSPGQSALLTGDYGQPGGNMGAPQLDGLGGFDPRTGAMGGGAMGKMGGGIGQPQGGGGWGGYGTGGGSRGQVPFYQWDPNMGRGSATPMPTPAPPPAGGPPTAAPPGGPYPGPKAAGGIDHMANLKTLMGEDPRLAQEYRTRNGDTINWWQQNQGNVAQNLFGGDNAKMQEWLRNTTAATSNAAPLSQAEMMRLNQMAGIRGPSWMR